MNSYDRYKAALREIADGAADPAAVAAEALRNRTPPPKIEAAEKRQLVAERVERAARQRAERTALAHRVYRQWVDAECPPITAFARTIGWERSVTRLRELFRHAERNLPWTKRRIGYTRKGEVRYLTNEEKR